MMTTYKHIFGIFALLLSCVVMLGACTKEDTPTNDEFEARSLEAWIKIHKPNLLHNVQPSTSKAGAFYVDVERWGDDNCPSAEGDNDYAGDPIMEKDSCWMYYNLTGYDLDGNVCITRNEMVARMQGTYSEKTRYVPYLAYAGEVSALTTILEATYNSIRNKLHLGAKYVAESHGVCRSDSMQMRRGSKVWLYSTSSLAYSTSGSSGSGGYEGQYKLDATKPMILEIEIMRVVKNPSDLEVDAVEALVADNNAAVGSEVWKQAEKIDAEKDNDNTDKEEQSRADEKDEDDNMLTGLYYNLMFDPSDTTQPALKHAQMESEGLGKAYSDSSRYADMASFDEKLNKILADKFKDVMPKSEMSKDNLVGLDGNTKIWYVARFLDGFVLDTNIPEVKELAFEERDASGSALSYNASSNEKDYIGAWYQCIPRMHYGSWAQLLTTSGYAYGSKGVNGETSTTSSNVAYANYDYYYYNYYGYYNNYYGYDYYNYSPYYTSLDSTSVDTSTISTEILAYTPLLFYIYIEPKKAE